MQAECTAFLPVLIFNGNVAEYYENGNVKTEGIYKDNKPIGIFQYFYNTGTLKERREYAADGIHYLESFSENGESLYINGKGLASEPADNGIQYLEIENHKCVARFTVDNANDTLYTQTDTPAKYRGGDERMLKDISKWIRLPSSAWRTGVNGQVFVSIVVGKTGAVEGVRLVQGFNKECDAEAVRVASLLKDWTPARHKGKTVRSAFVLPIKFRG
jgi:TonB family protein